MRRVLLLGAAMVPTAPAVAQAWIGSTLLPRGTAKGCYDLNVPPNPEWVARAAVRVDKAFAEYLALVRTGSSLKKLFITQKNWVLDGVAIDAVYANDPWADRIQKVERTNLIVSNAANYMYRATWNVYAADSQLLGRYDAWLQSGRGSAYFVNLKLYSPNSSARAQPVTAFCNHPGDIQDRQGIR